MSLTVQQVLMDARKVVMKISNHENDADILISEVETVFTQIVNMKQYQEEIEILNKKANQRPYVELIANIHRESKYMQEIQAQNKQLKNALEDHQHVLELIMSKYRQQTAALLRLCKTDLPSLHNSKYTNIITSQAEKINEMIAIMKTAATADEESELKEKELYHSLKEENATLRELVNIANKYGSLNKESETEDKTVQTDSETL